MTFTGNAIIKNDHPSLPGHFPGNTIVPGVVLLDQVRLCVQQWRPDHKITSLPQVKFHAPLLPEQTFSIHLEEKNAKFSFSCQYGETLLAQGSLRLEKRP